MMIVIFLLTVTVVGLSAQTGAAKELAAAERAFAAAAQQHGINAAFLEYLDDDALMFNPRPVNGKELYRHRTERPIRLQWRPVFVQVARSGDYGISTGPWTIMPKENDSVLVVGNFFSVWRKRKDGAWRVILDNGVSFPRDAGTEEKGSVSMVGSGRSAVSTVMTEEGMLMAEKAFAKALTADAATAYGRYASDDIRVLRNGMEPARERKRAVMVAAKDPVWKSLAPAFHSIASSRDMGFIHGVAVSAVGDSATFIRVWKFDNSWRLAADLLEPYKQ